MDRIPIDIALDVLDYASPQVSTARIAEVLTQGDAQAYQLRIRIFDAGAEIDYGQAATARIVFAIGSKILALRDGTISGDGISYDVKAQDISVPGMMMISVQLIDSNYARLTVGQAVVRVRPDPLAALGPVSDWPEVDQLERLITEATIAVQIANDTIDLMLDTNAAFTVWEPWDETKEYVPLNKVVYARSSFLCLEPNINYSPTENGNDRWLLIAKHGEDGAGSGDMRKDIYDTNDNGIADNAERLGNQEPSHYLNADNHVYTPPGEDTEEKSVAEALTELYASGGSGTVKSVNAVDPDEDGNIPLTAADIPMAGEGSGSVGESIVALDTTVAEHTDKLTATAPGQVMASTETELGVFEAHMRALELDDLLLPGAGPHNSIFRGKYLGDAPTAAQYAAISSGTFDDLYIGDYWTIGGVNYRIGEFDRYLQSGDTGVTAHHVTLVPDRSLYSAVMNDTSVTTGGYMGTKMRGENLAQAKATITAAFAGHIMTRRQYLTNAVTDGRPSGGVWTDSSVELMNEPMVYGGYIFAPANDGTSIPYRYTIDRSQLPLFAMRPDLVAIRENYWLRDVVSGTNFATVIATGLATDGGAALSRGVRPAFSIIG